MHPHINSTPCRDTTVLYVQGRVLQRYREPFPRDFFWYDYVRSCPQSYSHPQSQPHSLTQLRPDSPMTGYNSKDQLINVNINSKYSELSYLPFNRLFKPSGANYPAHYSLSSGGQPQPAFCSAALSLSSNEAGEHTTRQQHPHPSPR